MEGYGGGRQDPQVTCAEVYTNSHKLFIFATYYDLDNTYKSNNLSRFYMKSIIFHLIFTYFYPQ